MSTHPSRPIYDVDLKALHDPIKAELDLAIGNVLQHQRFINGPEVKTFEKELGDYLGAKVLGVANGSDALLISLLALDVGAGDEVIVPSFSYFASVEAILRVGAKPVFVDIDLKTYTVDVGDLMSKVTERTKVIMPVHIYGLACDMKGILDIAKSKGIYVIEDAAQAIGSCYIDVETRRKRYLSTIGDIGCISFFPSKNLGCFGDGGAIVTKDEDLLEKVRMIANHGQVSKYQHEIIGLNSRLDTLQASVLLVKFRCLDQWNIKRKIVAEWYKELLGVNEKISLPIVPDYAEHVFHQFTILINADRDQVLNELNQRGVPAKLYYPKSIHEQKPFMEEVIEPLSNTKRVQERMISLPIHPTLDKQDVEYVCNVLLDLLKD